MSWKQLSQSSLADSLASHHKSLEELDDIHELLDWSRIEAHLKDMFSSKRGEPAWPPLLMFKIMLLQQWYRLSDEGMEKQLARDLLFRRFTGLGLSDGTPDHTVIWRFHKLIGKLKLAEVLFEEINQQLCEQNIMIRAGGVSIIDATIIEAKNSRPKNGKNGENTQDKDAAYTSKKGSDGKLKTTYGFKLHGNSDEDAFLQKYTCTAANEHDSKQFKKLLTGEESQAYADSAYKSKEHDEYLQRNKIKNEIHERAYRNKPLTEKQRLANTWRSQVRNRVESVFGILKLHYGIAKARHGGLMQLHTSIGFAAMAYNLKRAVKIQNSCA